MCTSQKILKSTWEYIEKDLDFANSLNNELTINIEILLFYRISRAIILLTSNKTIPRKIMELAKKLYFIDINPECEILSPSAFEKIQHFSVTRKNSPRATIIGQNVVIGHECIIGQGVTLGSKTVGTMGWEKAGKNSDPNNRHPKIGNRVHIGKGALIIGSITIDDDIKIYPGQIINQDIKNNRN